MLSKSLLYASLVCSIIALMFTSIAMISASYDGKVIESLNWGYAHVKTTFDDDFSSATFSATYYIGILGLYYKGHGFGETVHGKLFFDNCSGNNVCTTCQNTTSVVYGFLAVFEILAIFSIIMNVTRIYGYNNGLFKGLGITSSVFSVVVGLISLIVFASTCMHKLLKTLPEKLSFHYGSAFSLLATAVCLMFVEVIVNSLVSTGESAPETEKPVAQQQMQQFTPVAVEDAPSVEKSAV